MASPLETQITLETARLMDAVYRNQRHVYDLTRKYYLLGRDLLIARLDVPAGGHVLELGCGTGRNLIAAARRYPAAHFYGLDISGHMLETARMNVARAGLSDRITLILGDASDPQAVTGPGPDRFDRVFYAYTLSMMPIWREALDAGLARLAPGGRLSVVDFGQQDRLPGLFRSVLFAWLRQFHVTPRPDMVSALADRAARSGRAIETRQLYRGYSVYAELGACGGTYSPATK